jgi:drug/metabolite transporter (DMT)-like permease
VPALLLGIFLKLYQKRQIFRHNYKLMLAASTLNALRMFLYFLSFAYTTVANGIIILYTWPIFSSIFGKVFLKEKSKIGEWGLIALAFFGAMVMVINQQFSFSNVDLLGMLFMLGSAAVYAITVIIFKKESEEYSPVETTFYQNLVGAFLFLPFIFVHWQSLTPVSSLIAMTHYGLIVGIGSFLLIFSALKRLKVLHFSLVGYWEIVAGVLFSVWLLGEKVTWNIAVGGLMIVLAGASLIYYQRRKADKV